MGDKIGSGKYKDDLKLSQQGWTLNVVVSRVLVVNLSLFGNNFLLSLFLRESNYKELNKLVAGINQASLSIGQI